MRRALVVFVSIVMAGTLGWGARATHQSMTSSGGATDATSEEVSLDVPQLLNEQMQMQQESLAEHMRRIEEAQLEHQARMQRDLGKRAPTATVAPMATLAPVETVPPAP